MSPEDETQAEKLGSGSAVVEDQLCIPELDNVE